VLGFSTIKKKASGGTQKNESSLLPPQKKLQPCLEACMAEYADEMSEEMVAGTMDNILAF